jgi:hypothetical protein
MIVHHMTKPSSADHAAPISNVCFRRSLRRHENGFTSAAELFHGFVTMKQLHRIAIDKLAPLGGPRR